MMQMVSILIWNINIMLIRTVEVTYITKYMCYESIVCSIRVFEKYLRNFKNSLFNGIFY